MDKEKIKYVLRFLISSLIISSNELLNDEAEKDIVVNTVLNTLVNILQPEFSLMFLDSLTELLHDKEVTEAIERQDLVFDIIANMKEQEK